MSASLSVPLSFVGVSLPRPVFLFADLRAERVFREGVPSLATGSGVTGSSLMSCFWSCSASESSAARASKAPLDAKRDLGAMVREARVGMMQREGSARTRSTSSVAHTPASTAHVVGRCV